MPPKNKEQAAAVAKALKEELAFAAPLKPMLQEKWANKLYDKPPDRSDITFQASDNVNPQLTSKPKEALAQTAADIPELEKAKHLFCMAHGDFSLIPGMDIDHSVAYSKIKENQAAFIAFLNENPEFADAFLAEPEMSNYFQRDPKDGTVKGTGYFYKICYNAIDNLWLVCHPCNITKSDQDELQWFSNNNRFGPAFIDTLNKDGGLHTGVMLSVVGGNCIAELKTGGKTWNVYTGGTGFGKFVRDWASETYEKEYKSHQQWKSQNVVVFMKEVDAINQLVLEGKEDEAKARFKNLQKNLTTSKNALDVQHTRYDSDSGSETRSQQAVQKKVSDDINVAQNDKKHHLRLLEDALKEKYPSQEHDIHTFFLGLLEKVLKDVPLASIIELRNTIEADLSKSLIPDWLAIKEKIKSSVKTTKEELALQKQVAAEEAQKRQAAEQAVKKEAQKRQVAEQEADRLKAQLAQLLAGGPVPNNMAALPDPQKVLTEQFKQEELEKKRKAAADRVERKKQHIDQDSDEEETFTTTDKPT